MYVNYKQDNWVDLLSVVEFSINNRVSATTGFSPFFLTYGFNPNFTTYVAKEIANPSATKTHSLIQQSLQKAKEYINKSHQYQTEYQNKKRRDISFAPGDMVLLKS